MCVPVQVFGGSDGLFRFFYVEFRAVRALRVQKEFLSSDFEEPTPSRRARGRVGSGLGYNDEHESHPGSADTRMDEDRMIHRTATLVGKHDICCLPPARSAPGVATKWWTADRLTTG